MNAMIIPHDQLSPEALNGVIEEFVSRDGTDYGEREFTLEDKVNQVRRQLKSGKAVIVYDSQMESCTIMESSHPAVQALAKK